MRSMSMMRSICPVVSSLNLSSQLGLILFWSMPHLVQKCPIHCVWVRYFRWDFL
jgi:hypothetical protein